jgi:hypothetical protein
MTITANEFMNGITLGASSLLLNSSPKSNFIDISAPTNTAIFIILILFLLIILLCSTIATYKITHSWLQVILCILFGLVYMSIAYMYYGLSGYKISK